MPTDVSLRPADESDSEAVAEVYLAARRGAPMPAPVHTDEAVRYWLDGRLQQDEVWVAEVDGVVAGYARMTPTWLDDLYVAPPLAGAGLGSALLDLVKARRPGGFCLWVFESNRPAQDFYARRGLVTLEHTDGSDNEEQSPDIRLAWPGTEPLAFLRAMIDDVDAQLGDLLARRSALTAAVQPWKTSRARDADRERQVVEAMVRRAPALGPDRLARIVDVIVTESLDAAERG